MWNGLDSANIASYFMLNVISIRVLMTLHHLTTFTSAYAVP